MINLLERLIEWVNMLIKRRQFRNKVLAYRKKWDEQRKELS